MPRREGNVSSRATKSKKRTKSRVVFGAAQRRREVSTNAEETDVGSAAVVGSGCSV